MCKYTFEKAPLRGFSPSLSKIVHQVKLAKHLVESSFTDKVLFANNGIEAYDVAIKFARKYQQNLRSSKEENST